MAPRGVITGIGLATPLGCTLESVWEATLRGEQVLLEAQGFSTEGLKSHLAGEVQGKLIEPLLPARRFLRLPRHDQFIAGAVQQCFLDWGADRSLRSCDLSRIGLFLGTSRGPLDCVADITLDLAANRAREVDPLKFQQTVLNAPLGHLSLHYRITGPCIAFCNGNTSALAALDAALSALQRGEIDLALAGGGDALTAEYYRALGDLRILSPLDGGKEAAAPFGRDRNGIMVAEGAAFVALERPETAREAGRRPYAAVESVAQTSDAWSYYSNEPGGTGYAAAALRALERAGLRPEQIDAIVAGASGDRILDRAEYLGLHQVWQERLRETPVLVPKGQSGDMGAGGSILALAWAAGIFRHGVLPPSQGCSPLDPEFDLRIPAEATPARCGRILCQDAAWGGLNAAVVLSAPESPESGADRC